MLSVASVEPYNPINAEIEQGGSQTVPEFFSLSSKGRNLPHSRGRSRGRCGHPNLSLGRRLRCCKCIRAIKEYAAIMASKTWKLVKSPPEANIIGCRWVYKIKTRDDQIIFKARLVAKDYRQIKGLDYGETFAPIVRLISVRLLLSMAAVEELDIYHFDVKFTFLHGELEEECTCTNQKVLGNQDQKIWYVYFLQQYMVKSKAVALGTRSYIQF